LRSKLFTLKALQKQVRKDQRSGLKVVFTNGCFDILHVGHVRYLRKAAGLGDRLVIALNTDVSVSRLKGPERPLNPQAERAEVLESLACVSYLVFFGDDTPAKTIHALKPDLLVKGGDWKKKQIVGWDFVESYGGKVRTIPYVAGRSTTGLVNKIKSL
jgi:D-beta-D-heptose 7-phosphate kinase/D-beta-D-heptose 1-phosphate adenosyltransferase